MLSISLNHLCCFFVFVLNVRAVTSLGCFVCQSYNNSDPGCDDSFVNNETNSAYNENCLSAMKGRKGLFPATACYKIKGIFLDDGTKVLIRGCSRDSGSLTMDTELSRIDHTCGLNLFQRNNPNGEDSGFSLVKFYGCIDVCKDSDGCNSAENIFMKSSNIFLVMSLTFAIKYVFDGGIDNLNIY